MTSQNDIAIELKHITKEYVIHHEKPTLVEKFYKGKEEKFLALNNISLTIKKGERVGFIGPNGSGKTTLLKVITGITTPTKGTVRTNGKIVSLIDLEAGFHPDLTGYQNIFINGLLLNMSKLEILDKIDSIIKFADIKQFIDTPLHTYSSGMILRLGFSVAVHANPDILIMDEGFAVGDINFRQKCFKSIDNLFRQGKTILVASHWLDLLDKHFDRIISIKHNSSILLDGGRDIIQQYKHRYKYS